MNLHEKTNTMESFIWLFGWYTWNPNEKNDCGDDELASATQLIYQRNMNKWYFISFTTGEKEKNNTILQCLAIKRIAGAKHAPWLPM